MPAFDAAGRYITINGKRKKDSWRTKDFPLVRGGGRLAQLTRWQCCWAGMYVRYLRMC